MERSKPVKANEEIAKKVSGAFEQIEDTVVGGYMQIQDAVVGGYTKVEDAFVGRYLVREGETIEQTKERLKEEQKQRTEGRG